MNSPRLRIALVLAVGLVALTTALLLMGLLDNQQSAQAADSPRYALTSGDVFCVTLDGGGPYASCTSVFTNVQAAIDAAMGGETIKVATGVYTSVNTNINKTVTIRGGYTMTNWTMPYPITQPTTLDAQGQGRVLFIGIAGGGPWITPTLEGLRITGGSIPGMLEYGGGVYIQSAEATFNNCQIFSNTAWSGGGLGGQYSSVTFNNSTIVSNSAQFGGGVLLDNNSDATLNENIVSFNKATNSGGGIVLNGAYATLRNTVIADNQADRKGGGLNIADSTVRLLHTTLARNKIINDVNGSGVLVERYSARTRVWMTNTIVVSHTIGISVTAGATATLESTLWGSGAWPNGVDWGGGGNLVTGTHNFWGDPAFAADGYHLTAGSAALNRGVDTGVSTDIDGNTRPDGCFSDLGADEFITGVICKRIYLPIVMRQ